MPNYYNPYNLFPATYGGQMGYSTAPTMMQNTMMPQQQSYGQQPPQQEVMKWVDGEIGAKAFQLPQGWAPNVLYPLWDSTDTVIYLKSINQMGMPNPIQKLHYTMENQNTPALTAGNSGNGNGNGNNGGNGYSGNSGNDQTDMSKYVTKDDFDSLREEIRSLRQNPGVSATGVNTNTSGNQNGSNNGNRGGRNGQSSL